MNSSLWLQLIYATNLGKTEVTRLAESLIGLVVSKNLIPCLNLFMLSIDETFSQSILNSCL